MIHRVDSCRIAPQAWRNGGGQTRELLAWPAGADWALRVSVADIDRDGPFSAYPEVQRWFTVLSGAGVRLDLAAGPQRLTPASRPVGFDGAEAPGCVLQDGPTRNLNLMARRTAGHAAMRPCREGVALGAGARWRGLFALAPGRLLAGDTAHDMAGGALAWSDDDRSAWRFAPAATGPAWWLTLQAPA